MKRLLLLTMMCLLGMFSVNAQETVTITSDSTTIDARIPLHTWWKYSYSQQIYTRNEINHEAGNILKIAFFSKGETSITRDVKIYMQNVTKSSFSSNEDWIEVTDADLVFDGSFATATEMEITLDKPFAYTGRNILLCVQDCTGEGPEATSFDIFIDNAPRSIFINDDDNMPGGDNLTGFGQQFCEEKKNILKLTFDGEGTTPDEPGEDEETTTLAAPVVTATASNDSTIVLTWEAVEGATKYYIYEDDKAVGDVTSLFCEMRGFEANTNYCFTVTAANDTMESEKSEPACAKTLDVALPDEPGEDEETTTLAAPTNLRATIRQDVPGFKYKYEITMAWDAVEGAKGYEVYVNTADTTGFQMDYTNGTAYVAGTNKESTFEFYVIAFDDSIVSAASEPCTVTVVDDAIEEMNASFNIYPNPVNDKLVIETEEIVKEVVVYDIYGRRQELSAVSCQPSAVDVSGLNSGVYFVKVVTANGEAVKRIIKN